MPHSTPAHAEALRLTLGYPVAHAHARGTEGPVRAQLCAYTDRDADESGDLRAALGYITAANGLFVRAQNSLFAATLPLLAFPGGTLRGLEPLTARITLRVPPPPPLFLAVMVAEAQEVARASGDEALWQVQWRADACDDEDQEQGRGHWRLLRPHQTRTPSSVIYDADAPHVVLTVHSHGRRSAFFSTKDDRDDGGLSFQAVLGDLLAVAPTLRFRVCLYGYRWEVPAAVLFAPDESTARLVASLPPLFDSVGAASQDSLIHSAGSAGVADRLTTTVAEQRLSAAPSVEAGAPPAPRCAPRRLLWNSLIRRRGETRL